jgi:hypothetical protein
MKRALEHALAQCLARLDAGADIEDCLRDQGPLAQELRPLLEAAQALRVRRGRIEDYTPQAMQKGRARMHAARARQGERTRAAILPVRLFGRPAALLGIAAIVAVLVALGFRVGLFNLGADTTSADVQGVVSRVDPDVIALTTADGLVTIRIGENTIVLDADGNLISGGDIVPGKPARAEVKKSNGDLVGQRIEVEEDDDDGGGGGAEVEFSGLISTIDGSTITMQASFGLATVRIDTQTNVNGTLAVGATAKVHATAEGDGSYLAQEIEIEGIEGGDDGGHVADDSGAGNGASDDADNDPGDDSRSGSSGQGSSPNGSDSSGSGSGEDSGDDDDGDGDNQKADDHDDDDKNKDDEIEREAE